MAQKTEKATPKKLRDARKKGQVAKSQDLPAAFTFIASLSLVLALSGWLYHKIGGFLIDLFKLIPAEDVTLILPKLYNQAFYTIFVTVVPILGLVAAIGVLVNFLAIGPMFAVEVFKFDVKKFNVVQNLKAKFKLKTLVELIKSLLKVSIAAYIIYTVMYKSLPVLTQAVNLSMAGALLVFQAFVLEVVIKVGLFFLVVAVLDFAYQKYNFGKEMMMEKFEVKQEYKNTEGDPMIKSKRKQIAREIAYSDSPAAGVQKAKAVVTNPIHLAVAIGYERELDLAPYILVMGEGIEADEITRFAEKYQIPVVRNIPLAHKLWNEGAIYEYVPEETYEALAEILQWISSLEGEQEQTWEFEEDEEEE